MGSPLSPDVPYFMRVPSDSDVRVDFMPTAQEAADGMEPRYSDIPTKLHTRTVETGFAGDGGTLGGHEFSSGFARYIGNVKPTRVAEADREYAQWWTSEYGVERMRRGFIAKYGEERGNVASLAVLDYLYSDGGWELMAQIAADFGRSLGWLRTMLDKAERYAHQRKTA